MKSKSVYYAIWSALIIAGLYQIFISGKNIRPELNLRPGQIADRDITAPFDYPVMKSGAQLTHEKDEVIAGLPIPYVISADVGFEQQKKLDEIFVILGAFQVKGDIEQAKSDLAKQGITAGEDQIKVLGQSSLRNRLYNHLYDRLTRVYERGVYEAIKADSIFLMTDDEQVLIGLDRLLEVDAARAMIREHGFATVLNAMIEQLADTLVTANVVVDEKQYNAMKDPAVSEIPLQVGMILKNEEIVRKNARVSEKDVEKLISLQTAYRNHYGRRNSLEQLLLVMGLFCMFGVVILMTDQYLESHRLRQPERFFEMIPINLGYVILVLIAIANNILLGYNTLLIPFAMTVIAVAILISYEFGVFYAVCGMIIVFPFVGMDFYNLIVKLVASLMTVMMLRKIQSQTEYLTIWLYLIISSLVAGLTMSLYKNDPIQTILSNIGLLAISSVISVAGLFFILPYFEKRWHRATKQTLLDLLDFNHPLLKRLAVEAAGTYHHSLIVGNLTERAAEAIGANPLLARVGSYYHDIGKVVNKDIFTENNESSSTIHDLLPPDQSASMIKDHVREGIELAIRFQIPQPVVDIIRQHHGTSTIRYFLDKAQNSDQLIDPQAYMYDGPRPKTKEAALVMLADIVESTTKSKVISSEVEIARIIDETTQKLIYEGQFNDAPITINDLAIVKESMLPVLASIYRKRLDYPAEKATTGSGTE